MFEELNRYAEKLQRPTGMSGFTRVPFAVMLSETSDHWTALCQRTSPRFFASLRITKNAHETAAKR